MDTNQDESLDKDFFMSNRKSDKIKEKVLDEDYKKARTGKTVKAKRIKEKHLKKKPFLLFGIALIIIGACCFVTVNYGPWLYVKYDPISSENVTIEETYYKDLEISDPDINNFFESYGDTYLGLNIEDSSPYLKTSLYISYALIIIGIVFTLIQVISKIVDIEYKRSLIIHSIFAASAAVICTYFIYISIKFFASFLLYLFNYNVISSFLGKPIIIFIVPILLIFIFSAGLKICFVVLKSDYNEFENIINSKRPKKSLFDFRYKGGRT